MLKNVLLTAALAGLSMTAGAATYHFTGNIENHNDVVKTYFTLDADATDVRVWTDSYLDGYNFDPITALWNADTGALIAQNDDNDSIDPSQTRWDSGFNLATLTAGNYLFTVATYNNWANTSDLAGGFIFDSETPIPLSQWCQPANACNEGTYWSVWLDGVSSATNPDDTGNNVPEPASLALLGLGVGALMMRRKRN